MDKDLELNILRYSAVIASLIGGYCLALLIDRATPGRKGRLRTERDHFFPEFKAKDVRSEMEKRLVAENFELQQSADPSTLSASRKRRPKDSVMQEYPFAGLKLQIDVQFVSREDGCIAKMAVSTPSHITRDTGESDYLEAVLDYLMLRQDFHPTPPVPHFWAFLSLRFSTILIFLPALFFLPGMEGEHAENYFIGILIAAGLSIFAGLVALLQIVRNKPKYTGGKQVALGIVLAIAAAAIAGGIQFVIK